MTDRTVVRPRAGSCLLSARRLASVSVTVMQESPFHGLRSGTSSRVHCDGEVQLELQGGLALGCPVPIPGGSDTTVFGAPSSGVAGTTRVLL